MKQFNLLSCGLLACASLVAVAPQCQADYVLDEGASMVTAQSPALNESHSNYSVISSAIASLDGTLQGQSLYTAKGGRTRQSGGNARGLQVMAAVTAEYYWDGGGIGPPFTFRFFPTYGGTASGSQGTYSANVKINGKLTGVTQRPPSPDSPQDDWDIGNGDVNFSYSSQGLVDGPTGNFNTSEGDLRSYPCIGTASFSVKNNFTSSGTAAASAKGDTASLQESFALYTGIAIDN